MSEGDDVFVTSELDIFAHKPIQTAVLETTKSVCKPIAPVEQIDLEFLIPTNNVRTST